MIKNQLNKSTPAGKSTGSKIIGGVRQDISADGFLAAIIESSDDAIFTEDLTGAITSWNRGAERLFGYTAEEMIGKRVTALFPPDWQDEEGSILKRIQRGEHVDAFETVRLRKDGSRVDILLTVSSIKNAAGHIIGASKIARDLAGVKRAEEIQRSEQRLRLILEAAPNGMVMVNERGVIVMVNAQTERLFGYTRAEMIGHPVEFLLPERYRGTHVGQRHDFFHSPATRAMGHGRDLFARRKDGSEFPVEVGLNPAETPDGMVVLAAVIDITQRKAMEAELAKVHSKLAEHARSLESLVAERTAHLQQTIGELEGVCYSLSHDMRAPLRAICSFSQIVLEEAGERLKPDEKELLEKAISSSRRLDRLIQDVLTYSRIAREEIQLTPINVERLLRQIIVERPELQKADIRIESPLLPVIGHEAYLTQCITNLLDNAVKFVKPGTEPRVRIWSESRNAQVRLWFEDNGIGIALDSHEQVFGIFQRLHSEQAYPGTGIGLAIVRKAVDHMGGTVGFESEPGRGSRFWLQLPQAQ